MGQLATRELHERQGSDLAARRGRLTSAHATHRARQANLRNLSVIMLLVLLAAPAVLRAQSGRQRPAPQPSPSPAAQRPRRATPAPEADAPPGQPTTPSAPSRTGENKQGTPASPAEKSSTTDAPVEVDDDEVYKVNSNLVPVSANATDATGHAVTDLKLEDFELRVDGQPKPISDLSHSETPVRIAFLFDNSSSIRPTRELEKQAAIHFFRSVLRPVDQAAIFSIETIPQLSQPLTNDTARLARTIERFGDVQESSTPLFDTIVMAAEYLRSQPGRKVLIILSDGVETTSNLQDYGEMVRRVLAGDCQVFVIQPGLSENANLRDLIAERRMQDLSSYTGGFVFVPKVPSDLEVAFTQIAADLAQQYVLSYYPTDDGRDGRFRVITLRVTSRPNVRVRARRGYYPRRHDSASSRQQSFDTDAVTRTSDAINDPAFAASQPSTARRDVSTNGAVAVVNAKSDAAPSRSPSAVSSPSRGSKNLDPEASGSSQSDDAVTNTRPVVRLAAPDATRSAGDAPTAGVANNSPPARDAITDKPPDAKTQPDPPATQADNDKPNASTATPSSNSTAAATKNEPAAKPAADANAKESPQSSTQQSAAQKSSPPASSQDSSARADSPRQSSTKAAQSQSTAQPSPQPSEPPKKLTVAGGVLNSRAKSLPVPAYPETARRMRVVGTVVVEVTVDESGRVSEARAVSGPAFLRQAAVDAARQARFQPPLVAGQPARLTGVLNYSFIL